MSVQSAALEVDWGVVLTGAGILVASIWATFQGLKKGKQKVDNPGDNSLTAIVGGTLMDNVTMRELTDALRANTEAVKEHTHQLERHNDLVIMIGHRRD